MFPPRSARVCNERGQVCCSRLHTRSIPFLSYPCVFPNQPAPSRMFPNQPVPSRNVYMCPQMAISGEKFAQIQQSPALALHPATTKHTRQGDSKRVHLSKYVRSTRCAVVLDVLRAIPDHINHTVKCIAPYLYNSNLLLIKIPIIQYSCLKDSVTSTNQHRGWHA